MRNDGKKIAYSKAFAWNIVGSMFNSIASFVMLLFVTRICGDYNAGIFSLAFATAQLMLSIGRYGMRAYQATDINEEIKFSSYFTSRIITCILMILCSIAYLSVSGYSKSKIMIIFFVCIIKMVDAIEDVFHGLLQQRNKLDVAGKLLALRNIFTILIFIIILFITKDILKTSFFTSISTIIFCLIINIRSINKIIRVRVSFEVNDLKKLFVDCFPLFAASFLSLYIYNVPKYAIDRYMSAEYQTYYGIIFMPAFVINLFSEFIFKPLLTTLAVYWNKNEINQFKKTIIKLLSIIVCITVLIIVGAHFIGISILSFVYSVDLNKFNMELIILLLGGGFGAGVYLLYNVLTTIRQQKSVLGGYLLVAIFSTIFTPVLVRWKHIRGASMAYLISSIILFMIFLALLYINIRKRNKIIFE